MFVSFHVYIMMWDLGNGIGAYGCSGIGIGCCHGRYGKDTGI